MNSSIDDDDDHDELHIFDKVYEVRPAKFAGIAISILNILLFTPMLGSIVWYEKFIADKRKNETKRDSQMFSLIGNVFTYSIDCLGIDYQCDQIGRFWKIWLQTFLQKKPKCLVTIWTILKTITF